MWTKPAHQEELRNRWSDLGIKLGVSGNTWNQEGKRLIRSWHRWPRKYHDTTHLLACLRHFSQVWEQLDNPEAVELALWFHDAVYWPWLAHNEEKSASWASNFMRKLGLSPVMSALVTQHILATRHQAVPASGDDQWVVDIDLAILGQTDAIYRNFEKNVRSEYRWVGWKRYVSGRTAVLQSFTVRPRVYSTSWFFDRYEIPARHNLYLAIEALAQGRLY